MSEVEKKLRHPSGTLKGNVVDGVFQPYHASVGEKIVGSVYQAFLVADSRRVGAVSSARKNQSGALHFREQQRGFVLPQCPDDFHVVFAAQVGPGETFRGHVEVGGQNPLDGGSHVRGEVAALDAVRYLLEGDLSEVGRGKLLAGLLPGPTGEGRGFDVAAVHHDEPGKFVGVTGGEMHGHVASPGVSCDEGIAEADGPAEADDVPRHCVEIVAVVGLGAGAVAAQVQRDDAGVAGEDGAARSQMPEWEASPWSSSIGKPWPPQSR